MERIAIVVFLWGLGALLFFLNTGALPQTRLGWVLFLVFAPPLYFVFELLGEALFGPRLEPLKAFLRSHFDAI